MNRLRELPPWQIILIAIGVLLVALVGGYLVITRLTTSQPTGPVTSTIPADLGGDTNGDIVKKLGRFEPSANAQIQTEPLRTPDPNAPSTVNPFSR